MVERHVTERMESALGQLAARYPNRSAKAFYLGPDDWADFIATNPPMIGTTWNCLPAYEHSFNDVPVRASKNVPARQSRLYDSAMQGRSIDAVLPVDGRSAQSEQCKAALAASRPRKKGKSDRTPEEMLASLGEDEGWLTWKSSPHVMWLGSRLQKGAGAVPTPSLHQQG